METCYNYIEDDIQHTKVYFKDEYESERYNKVKKIYEAIYKKDLFASAISVEI